MMQGMGRAGRGAAGSGVGLQQAGAEAAGLVLVCVDGCTWQPEPQQQAPPAPKPAPPSPASNAPLPPWADEIDALYDRVRGRPPSPLLVPVRASRQEQREGGRSGGCV